MTEAKTGALIHRGFPAALFSAVLLQACAQEPSTQRQASAARPIGPRTVAGVYRPSLDASGVLDTNRSAVVVVESLDRRRNVFAQGSGVIVGKGTVITAWPLVSRASQIRIRDGGEVTSAKVTAVLQSRGLARLGAEASEGVSFGRDTLPPSGTTVYSVGSAQGKEMIVTEGIVAGVREDADGDAERIETNASIPAGLTGGGLFNAQGELIGVLASTRAGEARGLAIPVRYVKDLLALPAGTLPKVTSSPLLRLPVADRKWLIAFMKNVAQGSRPLSGLGLDRVNALLDRLDPLVGAELEWVKRELGLGVLSHQRLIWEDAIESRAFRRAVRSARRAALEKDLLALGILTERDIADSNATVRAIAAREQLDVPGARIDATEAYLSQMVTQADRTRQSLEKQLWEARTR